MSMFHIPDIRLFWLTDKRFLSQFEGVKEGIRPGVKPPVFQELSKFPACYKDVSFFLPKGVKREGCERVTRRGSVQLHRHVRDRAE